MSENDDIEQRTLALTFKKLDLSLITGILGAIETWASAMDEGVVVSCEGYGLAVTFPWSVTNQQALVDAKERARESWERERQWRAERDAALTARDAALEFTEWVAAITTAAQTAPVPAAAASPATVLRCDECGATFQAKAGFSSHMRTRHPDRTAAEDPAAPTEAAPTPEQSDKPEDEGADTWVNVETGTKWAESSYFAPRPKATEGAK